MGKYEQLAKRIIENVGGESNISSLTHCVTRLRFQLVDESKANDDVLKSMHDVVTVMKSAGQYQVVIGNHVGDVYADVCKIAGISEDSLLNQPEQKKKVFDALIDTISGIFQPLLGVMSAAGMLKGLNALFLALGWYASDSGFALFMTAIGDAMFTYLPVMLGYTSAKKFGLKPFVGLTIGAALCIPAMQLSTISAAGEPLYSVFVGTVFESPVYYDIFGIPLITMDYTSTVMPAILICYLASKCEKGFSKVIPETLKFFFVPMLTLFVSLLLGFLLVGPIATFASNLVAQGVMAIRGVSPILAGALMGGFWQILVIFGIHWGIIPIYMNNITTLGYDNVMMPSFGGTFAQTAVVFAMMLKTKDKKLKALSVPAIISGIFGITEPAIYGITLPHKKPFIISCIAAAVAGAYYGAADLREYVMGGMGIFEFPSFINPTTNSFDTLWVAIIGAVIAMVIGFVLTLLFWKESPEAEKEEVDSSTKETIKMPIQGEVVPLTQVPDEAFSQGALGKGVAINPIEGKVVSPVTGTVSVLFPTKHAIGIKSDNGVEVLIHIGMDTVQLNGEHFKEFVKQGDQVEVGQKLIEFDIEKIKKAGYPLITPVIITNYQDYCDVTETGLNSKTELLTIVF